MSQHDSQLISQTRNSGMGEVPFEDASMFYSRTDERGIILEGNSVFRRISGFRWEELKGAPHKLVRHADMPKGVFHLFWERLKAGKQVSAYVKNRTKDGRFYWVLAVAWPIPGGYISVRVKPHTELFHKVRDLYAELRKSELDDGTSAARSAEKLLEALNDMGFESYDAFMSAALSLELEDRAKRIGVTLDSRQQRFLTMVRTIAQIKHETDEMTEIIKAIRTVPMNMRILASRLENAGGPISAISVNYGSMLDEMASWVKDFVEGKDSTYVRMKETIERGQFLVGAAIMQGEMSTLFEEDLRGAPDVTRLNEDRETLRTEAASFRKLAGEALKVVEAEATRLGRSVLDMKRYVTGLSSTRMMCKIESAALNGSGDSLSGIVDQLDAGQDEIEERLARIVELNTIIQSNTAMLRAVT
ncbi:MAG: PAS domain S-box protein [Rhodobacteraceae bacterium]|jgi:PAS domain S-box-containing protein|uniref:Aerotaxis receptor n=1 Tax=Salipiger profundus TaxID=1229727 RepID=A0A1U7D190_9RHOB|nr:MULTISPECIES: PAS domain-containing protein [Salipiger]APX21878.1 aerotaxis receptor [Salipiger profundus]MAB08060.1 PAS domain S-box protein [Paracoccaceae bacterium]SFC35538.1 aerotaxis receptor [Salipiger profundus]